MCAHTSWPVYVLGETAMSDQFKLVCNELCFHLYDNDISAFNVAIGIHSDSHDCEIPRQRTLETQSKWETYEQLKEKVQWREQDVAINSRTVNSRLVTDFNEITGKLNFTEISPSHNS